MLVRDADGKKLGRVRRCHPWGFEVARGIFSHREWVIRHDEVMDVQRGEVRVARSDDALFELAGGGLPRSWRRSTPPPGEAPLPSAPGEGDVEGTLVDLLSGASLDAENEAALGRGAGARAPGPRSPEPMPAHDPG